MIPVPEQPHPLLIGLSQNRLWKRRTPWAKSACTDPVRRPSHIATHSSAYVSGIKLEVQVSFRSGSAFTGPAASDLGKSKSPGAAAGTSWWPRTRVDSSQATGQDGIVDLKYKK